jgi:hypothetical protein
MRELLRAFRRCNAGSPVVLFPRLVHTFDDGRMPTGSVTSRFSECPNFPLRLPPVIKGMVLLKPTLLIQLIRSSLNVSMETA